MIRSLGRFRPEALFRPRSIALLGAATEAGQVVLRNLRDGGFAGALHTLETPAELARLQSVPDLGIIADELQPSLEALAAKGTGAAIALSPGPCIQTECRLLGPNAFGVIVPAYGLNASLGHLPVRPGKLALISPSAALCRSVLDWAEPNGVGFSTIVGPGAEADVNAADILDFLSREGATGAILLDIRTIPDRRAFLSAARAAARLRPIVAIHAGSHQHDPSGRSGLVFEAALRRAGILRVTTMTELLGAAEILTRARPPRNETLMVVTNAIGPGRLAADEAVRVGVPLAAPSVSAQAILHGHLPPQPPDPGLVWTGEEQPTRLAEAVAMLSALPEVGGVAAVLAPTGEADAAGVAALAACQKSLKMPMLACVLGETTGAAHRRTLAEAGVPAFAAPEEAVHAFAQMVRQRRARAMARELPSTRVLRVAPDRRLVRGIFAAARAEQRAALYQDEALDVLSAYGIPTVPGRAVAGPEEAADAAALLGCPVVVKARRLDPAATGAVYVDLPDPEAARGAARRLHGESVLVQRQAGRAQRLRIAVADDPLFGPAISFGPGGRDRLDDAVFELPPLNLALAAGLVARSRADKLLQPGLANPVGNRDAVADTLVRVSQLIVDLPEVASLIIDPLFADEEGVLAAEAWIALRHEGERAELAIAPYPIELIGEWRPGAETLEIRPIRPEDAEAEAALFQRLSPEDIRYRFFSQVRQLLPEQVARMTQIDYDREMAFVAVHGHDLAGVARLVRDPSGRAGEFAILIDAAWKGRGLGRHLMQRLIDWARSQGMSEIEGQVLADNAPMLAFVRRLGFEVKRIPEEPDVFEVRLAL